MSIFVTTTHSSMGEVDKGQPSSVRVPRHQCRSAHAVAIGGTSSSRHSRSPGTEDFPSWEAMP